MKTESLNKQSVDPKWYVVDADGQILGRFASKLADRLRGKDKPTFTPHTDGGELCGGHQCRKSSCHRKQV